MRAVLHGIGPTSWSQRLLLGLLAGNAVLLLLGMRIVAAARASADTWATLLATIGMQGVLALLALVGPLSFAKYRATMAISLGGGVLFALVYLGILACDFAGIQLDFVTGSGPIYAIFVGVALLAGALASLRTQRFRDGVVASCWALVIGTAIWSLGVLLLNY